MSMGNALIALRIVLNVLTLIYAYNVTKITSITVNYTNVYHNTVKYSNSMNVSSVSLLKKSSKIDASTVKFNFVLNVMRTTNVFNVNTTTW